MAKIDFTKCLLGFALLSALSLLGVTNAAANSLLVSREITTIDSSGNVTIDPSAISSVVLANYNTIQLTLFAPAGEQIAFSIAGDIGVNFQYANGQFDKAPAALCGVQFLGLQGPAPVFLGGSCGAGLAGNFFFTSADWTPSAGTSFTAMQFNIAVGSPTVQPPSNFNYVSESSGTGIVMSGATLQPVPEPATFTLLGTGLLSLWGLGRKKLMLQ